MAESISTAADAAAGHLERGAAHHGAGRPGEAVAEWRAGLAADAGNAFLHYNLGVALSEGGRQDEAVAHWREAVRLRPAFLEPHLYLAFDLAERLRTSKDKARWREARDWCVRTLALEPQAARYKSYLLKLLGVVQWELGERRAAVGSLKAALGCVPDDQWALRRLGHAQWWTGDWRGFWRTAVTLGSLPDYDPAPFAEWSKARKWLSLGLVLVLGIALARRLTRRGNG